MHMSECHGNRYGSQEFFHHREANCTHHQPTSKEMLPAWEGRQSGNAEQFLLQKTHSVASTVILTTYSVSVKPLFMSTLRRDRCILLFVHVWVGHSRELHVLRGATMKLKLSH
jgi:hypothetical protein